MSDGEKYRDHPYCERCEKEIIDPDLPPPHVIAEMDVNSSEYGKIDCCPDCGELGTWHINTLDDLLDRTGLGTVREMVAAMLEFQSNPMAMVMPVKGKQVEIVVRITHINREPV